VLIILPPRFDLIPGIGQGQQPILVQTLSSESAVERLDERIIGGLAGPAEVQFNLVEAGPLIHGLRNELTTVIDLNCPRSASALEQATRHGDNVVALDALADIRRFGESDLRFPGQL